MDVSIIIVNWNTSNITCDCLESVFEQTKNITFEVILIDNASTDDSVEMIKKRFRQVVLIENKNNRGFAAANNQGMKIATGRYILLLNSDTIVLDGAIQKTVAYADQHPEAGVIGCRALWPDGQRQNTCFRFHSLLLIMLSSLLFWKEIKLFYIPLLHPERYMGLDFNQSHVVDVVAGCFFLVRQEVVQKVGMFDEDFFMYGEEAEWCFRIHMAGWQIHYFSGTEIVHLYGASSLQVEDDTRIHKRKGTLLFLHKTRGYVYAWLANLIMTLGVLLRIPFWFTGDFFKFLIRRQPMNIWGERLNVVRFHLAGLLFPVWK